MDYHSLYTEKRLQTTYAILPQIRAENKQYF
jgi:hypothetical protein